MIRRRHLALLFLALVAVIWPCPARASLTLPPEFGIANLSLSDESAKSSAASSFRRAPLPRSRAGRRPSTNKGEAAGEAGWEGANHLGGYRYSAFGRTLEDTVVDDTLTPLLKINRQPLRWKGMWRFDVAGTELYDARARMWSPALGTFLSVDEFAFHDARSTLWAWPSQNPTRWRDPSGRIGTGDSPSSDRAIGANADWSSPAFQSTYNPAVEAGIGGFIVATFPALAYVLGAGMMVESEKDLPLLGLGGNPLKPMATAAEEAVCASTPVGRRGSPLTVPRGTNTPANIGGTQYSGHALDQMQGRGLTPSVVEDTLARGAPSSGYDGATVYTTEQARVVVNPDGSIKTVIPQ